MPLDEKHTGKNRATLVAQRKVAVDNRRAKVASGKVRGLSLRQIQAEMDAAGDVNPANGKTWSLGILGKDSIVLTERYKAEALRDTVTWIQGELQKLDEVERVAWEAWRRGIGPKKKTMTESTQGGKGGIKAQVTTEELNGDPRYLSVIDSCGKRRAQLLGLEAPAKTETKTTLEVTDAHERLLALIAAKDDPSSSTGGAGGSEPSGGGAPPV